MASPEIDTIYKAIQDKLLTIGTVNSYKKNMPVQVQVHLLAKDEASTTDYPCIYIMMREGRVDRERLQTLEISEEVGLTTVTLTKTPTPYIYDFWLRIAAEGSAQENELYIKFIKKMGAMGVGSLILDDGNTAFYEYGMEYKFDDITKDISKNRRQWKMHVYTTIDQPEEIVPIVNTRIVEIEVSGDLTEVVEIDS